ncbi:hypothetical protein Tco_0503076 [Tanacetum coccineum]
MSLKALDENFSSKNFVRRFLRALHPKWRAKVTTIEESKDLSSLSLDELIGNLKVHEVVMEKDSQLVGDKREKVKSLVSKPKKKSINDETSTSESENEKYVMAFKNFRKFIRRRDQLVRQSRDDKKSIQRNWKNKIEKDENKEKAKDEICLLADASNDEYMRRRLDDQATTLEESVTTSGL